VVLSPVVDETLSLEAVQAGAQDFLVKWQGDGFLLGRSLCYAATGGAPRSGAGPDVP